MSKPDWCPQDVWSAASASLLACLRDGRCGISVRFGMTGDTPAAFREAIARAILAERERCARVAEEYRSDNPFPTIHGAIARAILNPPDPAADGGGTAPIGAAATSGDGQ